MRERVVLFFFFNDTATTEIYTLSLHDALPISPFPMTGLQGTSPTGKPWAASRSGTSRNWFQESITSRSEEHTSELQSQSNLVCRLLLEKKNRPRPNTAIIEQHNP